MEFGPVIFTYSFDPGQLIPEVGETMSNDKCSMVVIESNKETREVKVMMTSTESVATRVQKYKEEIEQSIEDIAKVLYTDTATGMESLIGWVELPKNNKKEYISLAEKLVTLLDKKGLLILNYSDL
jgi:phage regulator Rha-like protein